jgi:hypothetical protein
MMLVSVTPTTTGFDKAKKVMINIRIFCLP